MINGAGKQAIKNRAILVTNSFAVWGAHPQLEGPYGPSGDPLNGPEAASVGAFPQKISNWPLAPQFSETER